MEQSVSARVYSAADLHLHTTYSDGRATPAEVLRHVAAHRHLRVIAITDHNTLEGAREAATIAPEFGITCIVGEEVSSSGGHIVGLFLTEPIPSGLTPQATIAAIHAQSGVAFAPHPFYRPRNPHRVPDLPTMESVGALVAALPLDAIEVINGTPLLGGANREAESFNRTTTHLPVLGCSDAHILDAIGKGYTVFPGETADDLRSALQNGETVAMSQRYTAAELMTYFQHWLRMSAERGMPAW